MTTLLAPTHHHQFETDPQFSLTSSFLQAMAQPFNFNWPTELTAGAPNVSAASSAHTSPSVTHFAHMSPGHAFDARVAAAPAGQAGTQYALPLHSASSEAEKHPSTLEKLGFSKLLSGDKKTRDGHQPKRRGPKPDSKPALTRRQELNRQAQRTHRERKELYIKALEDEVLRLKELYTDVVHERDTSNREREGLSSELHRLRNLLNSHGIPSDSSSVSQLSPIGYTAAGSDGAFSSNNNNTSSAASHAGSSSYNPASTATSYTSPPQIGGSVVAAPTAVVPSQSAVQPRLNYDQIGIDFVLALERPCFNHVQFTMVKAQQQSAQELTAEGDGGAVFVSGHALMASCPPASYVAAYPHEQHPHAMPDVGMGDLLRLLDLSNRLTAQLVDGEITPVVAWAAICSHERVGELDAGDFEALKENLAPKVRCYGFGAVLEEFEIRDAMTAVLAPKGPPQPQTLLVDEEPFYQQQQQQQQRTVEGDADVYDDETTVMMMAMSMQGAGQSGGRGGSGSPWTDAGTGMG